MIVRNRRIGKDASEIQLSLSYTSVDVRKMVQWIFACYYIKGCDFLEEKELATPHSQQEIIELFQCDWRCFGNYADKWSRLLGEWAFRTCISKGYIQESAKHPNTFFFTRLCLKKKPGRPPKNNYLYDE